MRKALLENPGLIERVDNITKILPEKLEIPGLKPIKKPCIFESYNLEIENQDIDEIPIIMPGTLMLSLWGNNFSDISQFEHVLKDLKAIWLNENPISNHEANLFSFIEEKYPNIEILNSKLTTNAKSWAIQYLVNSLDLEKTAHIDLSDRQVNRISPEILNYIPSAFSIDISGNVITQD